MTAANVVSTGCGEQPKRASVLQLVPRSQRQSLETAQALSELVALADSGEIIGFAYVTVGKHRRVTAGTVGSARTEPELVTYWIHKLAHILLQH